MKKHEGNFILTLFSNSPVTFSQTWCHFTKTAENPKTIISFRLKCQTRDTFSQNP